ncbi:MAG TPA: ATP-binding cassette domain-containing protein [Treponemataceae bacterium]|mgnify:CR=1 FL=1|nr:ATP-binding cassette domain-containing protein [Treponemataceae bacterium]
MKKAELRDIRKVYGTQSSPGEPGGSCTALDGVSLDFLPGEMHALLGENGAGKSTLVHIFSGLNRPTAGCVIIGGKEHFFSSPRDALAAGVAMVHQRPLLAPGLSALDNVILGEGGFFLNRRKARLAVGRIARDWGIKLDLDAPVAALPPADRLRTELLAALYSKPDFLVLDEPTAVLAPEEREAFLASVRRACSGGVGVILITHRLAEAARWADRITVLRHGKLVYSSTTAQGPVGERVTEDFLANLIDPDGVTATVATATGNNTADTGAHGGGIRAALPVFAVRQLTSKPNDRDGIESVSFEAYPGEIVGIFGLRGSGLETLEDVITGMRKPQSGDIMVGTEILHQKSITPARLRSRGVAIIPSDRAFRGAHPNLTIRDALTARGSGTGAYIGRPPFAIRASVRDAFVLGAMRDEGIDASPSRRMGALSGGQVQRLMLARELAGFPRVIVCASPEWGLDIAGVSRLRSRLTAAATAGCAVVVLSDDMDSVNDRSFYARSLILSEGRLP